MNCRGKGDRNVDVQKQIRHKKGLWSVQRVKLLLHKFLLEKEHLQLSSVLTAKVFFLKFRQRLTHQKGYMFAPFPLEGYRSVSKGLLLPPRPATPTMASFYHHINSKQETNCLHRSQFTLLNSSALLIPNAIFSSSEMLLLCVPLSPLALYGESCSLLKSKHIQNSTQALHNCVCPSVQIRHHCEWSWNPRPTIFC